MKNQQHSTPRDASGPSPRDASGPTFVLHGYATRMYAFLLWALAAIAIGTGAGYGFRTLAGMIFIGAALAALGWLSYWNPRVILNDEGAAIVNPLRTTKIKWKDIEKCTGHWGLQITPRGCTPIHVWSVPSRAAVRESWAKPKAPQPVVWDEHAGTESLKVTSGRAAEIINLRAAQLRADNAGDGHTHNAANNHADGADKMAEHNPEAAPATPTVEFHVAGAATIALCTVGGALLLFV